jgi:hypothetical protein
MTGTPWLAKSHSIKHAVVHKTTASAAAVSAMIREVVCQVFSASAGQSGFKVRSSARRAS